MDGRSNNLSNRLEYFLLRCNLKHNFKYDYTNVVYKNNDSKIEIICPTHGLFHQIANNHLLRGCKICGSKEAALKNLTLFEIFEENSNLVHSSKYTYLRESYKGVKYKIEIICPIHGKFEQSAFAHMNGSVCSKCDISDRANNQSLDCSTALNKLLKVHGDRYTYDNFQYKKYNSKIKVTCTLHGEFNQRYDVHLSGCGCGICNISIGESVIMNYLKNNNIIYVYEKKFSDCKNINALSFDFYLPDLNIAIEFDGIQHYESIDYFGGYDKLEYTQKCDAIKNTYCINNNIKLIRIKYSDIANINKILSINIKQT